jgi:DNA-binding beta-propeller fold protein YncE
MSGCECKPDAKRGRESAKYKLGAQPSRGGLVQTLRVFTKLPSLTVIGCFLLLAVGTAAQGQGLPSYKVDPFWPKQLPNNWIMGQVGGMAVDKDDHIWVFQRPRSNTVDELSAAQNPPLAQCCKAAPSVLVFDKDGNLLKSWGGPGHVPNWPVSEHGIAVDKAGNVWLSGNFQETKDTLGDREILKFSNDGKLLMTIGHSAKGPDNNQETGYVSRVSSMVIDEDAHELYAADGYGNRRVIVFDTETGKFKRGWGAYGIPLSQIDNGPLPPYDPAAPPAKQFLGPVHCIRISNDGFVYVCDRTGDRIQVFTKQGKFVKEFFVSPKTLGNGAPWTLSFSNDPQQKYMLVGDGRNNVIWILNRDDGKVAGSFGHNGRNAGQFHWVHQAVVDSQGNLYTGEVDTGKRIQKFILQK